ncbi:hypothetical protein [Bacillus sp. AFS002410]|uniref:hypothetical protein n=1 Tax=Bacillus sp. AFS002410 TaxID=2033481 RepID=UPI0011559A3B|nr:hypothetical protein [Bacillus sp. AFS002410]
MNKEQVFTMARDTNCQYDIGIWSDINAFLENNEDRILNWDLKFNEVSLSFYLSIKLENPDKQNVRSLFQELVYSTEYTNTIYVREISAKSINYYMFSSTEDKKGFIMEIQFLKA